MFKAFLVFVFILPFQMRIYKFLKPLSLSWISPSLEFPAYFEPHADFFISDFFLVALLGLGLLYKCKLMWSFEQKTLLAFIGIAFISILTSNYQPCLISYWRWGHLVISALLVYFILGWMGPFTRQKFKALATVVVCSAMLECAIALPQYFLQHQIGAKILGEQTLISRHYTGPNFQMPKKALTVIDYYAQKKSVPSIVLRAQGTFPHANVLGGFLMFSLFMTCFLYENSSRKKLIGAALILQCITLFTTYSRAGLFAFFGGMIIFLAWHYWEEKKIAGVWRPLFLGLGIPMLLFYPQIFYRGGVVSYNEVAAGSDQMRVVMQNVATLMLRDHPWFGVGFNNYLLAFSNYAKTFHVESVAVHNIYLLIGVETGLVGLIFFLIFCGVCFFRGWQNRNSLEGRTLLIIFLAFLAIGAVDYYPILQQQTRLIFFLTAGLILLSHCPAIKPAATTAGSCLRR